MSSDNGRRRIYNYTHGSSRLLTGKHGRVNADLINQGQGRDVDESIAGERGGHGGYVVSTCKVCAFLRHERLPCS